MIKTILTSITIASLSLAISSCNSGTTNRQDSAVDTSVHSSIVDTALYAALEATKDKYMLEDTVELKFTVHNPTADTMRFTQYHTPFEGMFSKFLVIENNDGKEVEYTGAMTRRIMPPPEDTYHTVAPHGSESVLFTLDKGYKFDKTGTYKVQYVGEGVNGIKSGDAIEIHIIDGL